jgi:REP element-mobilizing transposase RayT
MSALLSLKNVERHAEPNPMKIDASLKPPSDEFPDSNSFFNPYAPIQQHKHRLPHWQQGSVHYFVTWRLADSLPKEKLERWSEERNLWLRRNPPPWSHLTEAEYRERFSDRMDDWLDAAEGSCLLGKPLLARFVANALLHYDNERYMLDSFVVMPNHVHTLFRLMEPHRLEDIVKSWKGFTAREINRRLQRRGSLWQEDYWDRLIRNETHWAKCREYICDNPRKARLAQDQFLLFVRTREGGFSNPPK